MALVILASSIRILPVCVCACGAGIINVVGSEICSHVMGTRLPYGCTQAVKLRLHLQEINAVCVL